MNDEQIIRDDAYKFIEKNIRINPYKLEPVDEFSVLRDQLSYYYSDEHKAIYLDETQARILEKLELHRSEKHSGKADPKCQYEINTEKLLFYIKQELNTLPIVVHQKKPQPEGQIRDKVFLSYSHKDKEFVSDIKKHFKPFSNQIDFWDDSRIEAGQKWKEEIIKAIATTKVAILLLSADFLASDFISNNELPPLLKAAENEGAIILILILKPCLFEEFEHLNQYQALNPPSKPLSRMDDNDKEDIFVNLVRQTKKLMKKNEV